MKNKGYILLILLALCGTMCAQPGKVYKSLSDVRNPEEVYILRLRHKRLKSVPKEIFTFTNLEELDLSRNRLTEIPPEIVSLQHLKVLRLGRNDIDSLPTEVSQLSQLEELDVSRNPIVALPEEMGYMLSLRKLILWSTPIYMFPESFAELDERLHLIDMRACTLSLDDQKAIRALLPTVRILWDQACNCK